MVFYEDMLERLREEQIPGYKKRKEQPRIEKRIPDVHYHPPKHYDAPKPDRGVDITEIFPDEKSARSLDKLLA